MKIVVSTFNNSKNNYGAMFQSCGLYSFLTKLGHEVGYVTLAQREKPGGKRMPLKTRLKRLLLLPHKKQMEQRVLKLRQFGQDTQHQLMYQNKEELFANPPQADVYLSGSDQVWNPVAMHEDLFLAYAPADSKRISYAASMGNEKIPEANKERFAELIGQYEAVSVREDTVMEIVRSFTDKTIHHHIDPVFLKPREEWEALEIPYAKLKHKRYILTYIIDWNAEFAKQLAALKKQTGLPIVAINLGNLKKIGADQVIYDASPREFLYLLHHADTVVATSFHGVAMSIIYNKPFLPLAGAHMPTRIQSLMRHFEIDMTKSVTYGPSDFERINAQIEQDRQAAKDYLEAVIG